MELRLKVRKMVYRKDQIFSGAHLRIELNGVFEGWAELLEAEGDKITSMSTDQSPMVLNQRWLIRFLYVDEVETELSAGERMTQINQSGRHTHRVIRNVIGSFISNYRKYSKTDTPIEKDLLLDDFNDIF